MARIAVGGFQHETNTFAPGVTDYNEFELPDGWPGLTRGNTLLRDVQGVNIPVAGFVDYCRNHWHDAQLKPLLWCSAPPGGPVSSDAFERILGMMIDDLRLIAPVDAVYLDLHGAMVSERFPDGEAEILRRVREVIGADVPLVISLDLHGNVSWAMIEHADYLDAYRTYPHLDMADTGVRVAEALHKILRDGRRLPYRALRKAPYLIPLTSQCTLVEPMKGLYQEVEGHSAFFGLSCALLTGFPAADVEACGPSVVVYGENETEVERAANSLLMALEEAEADFDTRLFLPQDAVAYAMQQQGEGPVVIADTQDNPGAGSSSDTTGMLEALLTLRAQDAVIGMLFDPKAAQQAHQLGEGKRAIFRLGNHSGAVSGAQPVELECRVVALGDGQIDATGPMYGGSRMQLGPMALLEVQGIQIAVASRKQQAGDRSMFRHLGVEVEKKQIVVLKSSVHFRADFMPIAQEIIVALAPGPNLENPEEFPYLHLREGIRLRPGGPAFNGRKQHVITG